jgi:hypothetical protein
MTKLPPPEHQDQWWAPGAHVHVRKSCAKPLLAGKSLPVANGRLIACSKLCPNDDCNGLAVTVRVFDLETSVGIDYVWPDGTQYWRTGQAENMKRRKNGEKPKTIYSDGWTVPRAVCMSDLARTPRKGYRWCGHKIKDKKCRCSIGFDHLKKGAW